MRKIETREFKARMGKIISGYVRQYDPDNKYLPMMLQHNQDIIETLWFWGGYTKLKYTTFRGVGVEITLPDRVVEFDLEAQMAWGLTPEEEKILDVFHPECVESMTITNDAEKAANVAAELKEKWGDSHDVVLEKKTTQELPDGYGRRSYHISFTNNADRRRAEVEVTRHTISVWDRVPEGKSLSELNKLWNEQHPDE